MTIRLRIGNNLNGDLPAKGRIANFRAGHRKLSEYTYRTLPLNKINPAFRGDIKMTVNEIARYFTRTTEARMTTGATMFAGLKSTDVDRWYSRPQDELMVGEFENVRNYGQSTIADESIGLSLNLYRLVRDGNAYRTTQAYFDNAMFKVSNVLWEFSPDGGKGKWYQLYDLPNRAYTRITLPRQTTRLRVRALSNNPEEWVQSFAITPKPDLQKVGNEGGPLSSLDASIDDYAYIKWIPVEGGSGNIYYEIWKETSAYPPAYELVDVTRESFYQLPSATRGDRYFIVATDELGDSSMSDMLTYGEDMKPYTYLNYELLAQKGYASYENGTITLTGPGLIYTFGPRYNVTPHLKQLELNKADIRGYDPTSKTLSLFGFVDLYSKEGETDLTWENDTYVTDAVLDSEFFAPEDTRMLPEAYAGGPRGMEIALDKAEIVGRTLYIGSAETGNSRYENGTMIFERASRSGDIFSVEGAYMGHRIDRLRLYRPDKRHRAD